MKGLLLLSGGIDSPVAGDRMMKLGMELEAVHFHSYPITDKKSIEKCKVISIKFGIKMHLVGIADIQNECIKNCKHKYYYIITRRLMYKIAEKIAKDRKCEVLITGDNLGQVASQTLSNLMVVGSAVEIPILRPLLTMDKEEIIDYAKKIDTFEISKGPEICCLLGPKNPATSSKLYIIEKEEENLPKNLVQNAYRKREETN